MNKNLLLNFSDLQLFNKITVAIIFCFTLSIGCMGYSGNIYAANNNSDKSKKTKAPLIRKRVYNLLEKAQDLVTNKKYKEAILILDKIKAKKRLNSSEGAQLWNFYAYIYFSQDQYKKAIGAYQILLQQENLQLGIKTGTLYTLSQLHFLSEDYKKALVRIQEWIALSETPSPEAYALLGQAFYKLEEFNKSIPALTKAIELRKSSGKPAKENWYLLLRANHYELKDYKKMIVILTELLTIFPKKQYFQDLAGSYSQLGDTKKQLGIMESMYEKGYLTKESQIKNLANLFLIHQIPYKSAKILTKAIEDGVIEKNEKNLGLLSQSWIQARENKQAIEPLKAASKLSKDSAEPFIKLGRAYANLDQWSEAIEALETGLKRKGVKQADSAYILLGMAYYNQKNYIKAKSAFTKATKTGSKKQNKKTAQQWIVYLDTEIKRQVALSN